MSKDQNIQEIHDYLSGKLTPELREAFEKRLLTDFNLQEDFETTKQTIEGIQGYAFKNMLKRLHAKHFGNKSM